MRVELLCVHSAMCLVKVRHCTRRKDETSQNLSCSTSWHALEFRLDILHFKLCIRRRYQYPVSRLSPNERLAQCHGGPQEAQETNSCLELHSRSAWCLGSTMRAELYAGIDIRILFLRFCPSRILENVRRSTPRGYDLEKRTSCGGAIDRAA